MAKAPPPQPGLHPGITGRTLLPCVVCLLVVATARVMFEKSGGVVAPGAFFDGDSYLRLVRVRDLLGGGGWFDAQIPRANAPFGFTPHWTRLYDLVLAAIALPLTPFRPVAEAVHVAGLAVGPVFHLLTALALAWAARPLLGAWGGALAGTLMAVHPAVLHITSVGVADHHGLFLLLVCIASGFFIRSLLCSGARQGHGLAAGAVLSLGVWVGVETFLFIAVVLAVGAMTWLVGAPEGTRRNVALTTGLVVGVALSLAAERGSKALWATDLDRISLFHLGLAACAALAWFIIALIERNTAPSTGAKSRIGSGLAGLAAGISALGAMSPWFGNGLFSTTPPEVLVVFSRVVEFQPLGFGREFLIFLGGVPLALPWLGWRALRAERAERWAWLSLVLALAVFVVVTLAWRRFAFYTAPFVAVGLSGLVVGRGWSWLASGAALLAVAVPLASGGWWGARASVREGCSISSLVDHLDRTEHSPRPLTILGAAEIGPELLYRTRHRVVATMHHGNRDGLIDSLRILRATNDDEALRKVRERKIDLIVLCPALTGKHYARPGDPPELLYRRLLAGRGPLWLAPPSSPPGMDTSFLLYWVVPQDILDRFRKAPR
jgi:hypothetical protein